MCILLVEDEFLIRLILGEELAESGFEVCEAEDGDQASVLITTQPDRFTLLVTDIDIPGELDGAEIADLFRARRPNIPVVFMTGRPGGLSRAGRLGARDVLLVKPFTPCELVTVVRRLLGAQPKYNN